MSAVTVGDDIEKAWSFLLLDEGLLATVGVDDSERVVTVDTLCMPCLRIEAGSKTCRIGIAHGLASGLATHCVLVVHDIDHERKTALHVTFPECIELIHRSEGHSLEDRTACHGTVTEVGDNHARLAVYLLVEGCTGSDRT